MIPNSQVAHANEADGDQDETYSDEEDYQSLEDGNIDEVDTTTRLRQPLSYNRSLMELLELVKDERYMNINPDYQREVVWSEGRMVHLVDSLFNNYYVPPLIFKVISGTKPGTNERRRWRTCIDGKQRLTTIRKFFDGEIPYIDEKRQKWYYCQSTDRSNRKILSDEEKEFIDNVQIVNIEFEFLTEEEEEDMFQRVQLGVPLTVAEKLSAHTGQLPSFVNDMRSAYTEIPHLVGIKRSNDFRFITQLLLLMHQRRAEGEDLKLKRSQDALKKFLEDKNPQRILTPQFRHEARKVFSIYNELIASNKDAFTHSFGNSTAKMRRFSPIEFLGVGIMLYVYPDRPLNAFVQDIKAFREYLRDRSQDLRTNSATWSIVMTFVNQLEQLRGFYPPENDAQAAKRSCPAFRMPLRKGNSANPPLNRFILRTQGRKRKAFNRIPASPPRQPVPTRISAVRNMNLRRLDFAGGVQDREQNGSRKRTYDGVPVKREGR